MKHKSAGQVRRELDSTKTIRGRIKHKLKLDQTTRLDRENFKARWGHYPHDEQS